VPPECRGSFYPGTGAADEVGTDGAEGHTVNVAWSGPGMVRAFTTSCLLQVLACNSSRSLVQWALAVLMAANFPIGVALQLWQLLGRLMWATSMHRL